MMRRNTLQATVGSDTVPGDMKGVFALKTGRLKISIWELRHPHLAGNLSEVLT